MRSQAIYIETKTGKDFVSCCAEFRSLDSILDFYFKDTTKLNNSIGTQIHVWKLKQIYSATLIQEMEISSAIKVDTKNQVKSFLYLYAYTIIAVVFFLLGCKNACSTTKSRTPVAVQTTKHSKSLAAVLISMSYCDLTNLIEFLKM